LLSVDVRRASGQSLRNFAAERNFKPLGITHTEIRDDHTALIQDRALGYQPNGSTYRISQPEFDVVGDGGVYSTIDDLAKWDANFRTGTVGGRGAIDMLQQAGRLNNGQTIPYALALTIGQLHGLKTYSHNGAYGGYRSTLLRFPEKDLSVITLCNTSRASSTLAEQVGSIVLGLAVQKSAATALDLSPAQWTAGSAQAPYDSSGSRRRNDLLSRVAGNYYSDELDLSVNLATRDGYLVFHRPRASEIHFVSFTDDLFTNSDRMLLRVVRDDHGGVIGFTLTINRVRDLEFLRRDAEPAPKGPRGP
jgi:CubicO group peptidase (beta-lactamase class C family)